MVSRSFLFVFHAGSRGLGSNNSRNSSYKEKTAGSARISRLSFRFLWLRKHVEAGWKKLTDLTKKVEHISQKRYDLLLGRMYFTGDDGYQNFLAFPSMLSSLLKCTRKKNILHEIRKRPACCAMEWGKMEFSETTKSI